MVKKLESSSGALAGKPARRVLVGHHQLDITTLMQAWNIVNLQK
jgi:hypothetical protein